MVALLGLAWGQVAGFTFKPASNLDLDPGVRLPAGAQKALGKGLEPYLPLLKTAKKTAYFLPARGPLRSVAVQSFLQSFLSAGYRLVLESPEEKVVQNPRHRFLLRVVLLEEGVLILVGE
jgi:hypothetical protein